MKRKILPIILIAAILIAGLGYEYWDEIQVYLPEIELPAIDLSGVTLPEISVAPLDKAAQLRGEALSVDTPCLPRPGASVDEAITWLKAGESLKPTGEEQGDYIEVESPRYVPTCWVLSK